MNGLARHRSIRVLAHLLCAPALMVATFGAAPLYAGTVQSIVPPKGSMILRRTLERELAGGAKITVTREWECRFVQTGRTVQVEGIPRGVTVDAPPSLAGFAEIERKRATTGPFPALLDAQGSIVMPSAERSQQDVDKATDLALSKLRDAPTHEVSGFLQQIAHGGADQVGAIPPDLFYPTPGQRHEEEAISLPDGGTGLILADFAAEADPATGLLKRWERRIITRIGDSERVARESWELIPN